jgi:hypothetical protein
LETLKSIAAYPEAAELMLSLDAGVRELQHTLQALAGTYLRDPAYDRLFSNIVMTAPAPIGLGQA